MLNRRLRLCAALAVGLSLVAWAPATAWAIGYYNLPGNFCQCFGYGNGPGYHAPLVLGPVSCHGCCHHGVERLPSAPCSPYAGFGCGYGCGDCGCDVGEPSLLEPTAEPMPAPGPMLEPAPTPAAFRVPFRY